jgi:phospholipase/lecithinase/hemolysin
MFTHRTLLMIVAAMLVSFAQARAGQPGGIGVMGDSYSDEYQFYPPDRATARNWVEILVATRGLNFGGFSRENRGEPRNQGYEYNWARSDATTSDMIATGQHTGLAAQVARGEVGVVFVFIGGNDFISALHSEDPAAALAAALPLALKNYRTAVDTILAASPDVKLVVATLPDIRDLPEFAGPLEDGLISRELAGAFTAALWRYNTQIRVLAASEPRAALLDLDLTTRAAKLVSREFVCIGGRRVDLRHTSNDLGCFFLADVRHPGTLGQGILARMFVQSVNAKFGTGIEPLNDHEVVKLASGGSEVAWRGAIDLLDAEVDLARAGEDERVPVHAGK